MDWCSVWWGYSIIRRNCLWLCAQNTKREMLSISYLVVRRWLKYAYGRPLVAHSHTHRTHLIRRTLIKKTTKVHGGGATALRVLGAPETFGTLLRIRFIGGPWCSQKRIFKLWDLIMEGSLLRNFERRGRGVNHGTSEKRLSVQGHRREKLFDWYFSSTILMYLHSGGCRDA